MMTLMMIFWGLTVIYLVLAIYMIIRLIIDDIKDRAVADCKVVNNGRERNETESESETIS